MGNLYKKSETIVIRIEPDIKKELEMMAVASKRSLADFIRLEFEKIIAENKLTKDYDTEMEKIRNHSIK